jgi:hypothetical protein
MTISSWATSAMFGLSSDSLVVGIETPDDPHLGAAEASCASMGATIRRIPAPRGADERLALLWSFPSALALALRVALQAGRDPDAPSWADAYLATVRQGSIAGQPGAVSR